MKRILILVALVALRALLTKVSFDEFASREVGITLNFGFLLLCAYLVGEVFAQWRLPKITGYILAGISFGPHATGFLGSEAVRDLKKQWDVLRRTRSALQPEPEDLWRQHGDLLEGPVFLARKTFETEVERLLEAAERAL